MDAVGGEFDNDAQKAVVGVPARTVPGVTGVQLLAPT